MSLNTNPLGQHTRSHIRSPGRAGTIPGDFTDNGRYFRCRKCGFICDVNRDLLLPKERAVIGVSLVHEYEYLVDELGNYITDGNGNRIVTGEGEGYIPIVKFGCPLCGSTRWKE